MDGVLALTAVCVADRLRVTKMGGKYGRVQDDKSEAVSLSGNLLVQKFFL